MTLGALACFHFHLTACRRVGRAEKPKGAWPFHCAAAAACAAACLSNVVGAVIPAIVTSWDVLALERSRWRRIMPATIPLWLAGLTAIAPRN